MRLSTPKSASNLCVQLVPTPSIKALILLHSHNGYLVVLSDHFSPVAQGRLHSQVKSCNCVW